MENPKAWPKLSSESGPDLIVARTRFDMLENPRTGAAMRRTVLECPDWVNVVALTPEREIILVRQFRFGTERLTTEVPGGVVDPGEAPLLAAQRELREETGFTSERWSLLASIEPNPAFLNNHCHQFLALDAQRTHALELDEGEDIQVVLAPEPQLMDWIKSGEVNHSLVLSALAWVFDLRGTGPS
jgi:ADP-ribose pyrophosphatase